MNSVSLSSMGSAPAKHVKVLVRTRPTSEFAAENVRIHTDQKSISLHVKKAEDGGFINNQQDQWDFKFDGVMHNASQEQVYDVSTATIVNSLFEGYNGTILAYGQTGAGKTFTMTGATENYKHRGVIPRAITQVFKEVAEQNNMSITVRVSYLEIYNETMVDLLNLPSSNNKEEANGMTVMEDKTSGVVSIKGLSMPIVSTDEEALNLLFEGESNRSISDHLLNKNSTRSHCIFTVYIESRPRNESSERVIYSKLNLVDLAGSERLSKTQTKGVNFREALHINRSLTFLEQVILALADKKRDHIPYRQSRLTNVLRDALGGNCNTLMIANIRGEKEFMEETISTLRFATRMMCVTTTPVVNVQFDPLALIRKYEKEIKQLKQELAMHDALANRSHVQYEPFSDSQKFELQKRLKYFLDHDDDEFEIVNLRQVKEMLNQFRITYRNLNAELQDQMRKIPVTSAPSQNAGDLNGTNSANAKDDTKSENKFMDEQGSVGEADGFGFGIGTVKGSIPAAKQKPRKTVTQPSGTAPNIGLALGPAGEETKDPNTLPVEKTNTTIESSGTTSPVPTVLGGAGTNPTALSSQTSSTANNSASANIQRIPVPSRAEEFESYKRGKGAELNRILNENKLSLKDKKTQLREMSEAVNELKFKIDDLKASIESKQIDRIQKADGSVIIGETEYALLMEMKEFKKQYREQYDAYKKAKAELDYKARLVDQSRQKLMSEFEAWFEAIYGAAVAGNGIITKAGQSTNDSDDENDDLMDVQEKFDKLQLERIMKEDPESYAFYNARRNQERRLQKNMAAVTVRKSIKDSSTAANAAATAAARRRSSSRMQLS